MLRVFVLGVLLIGWAMEWAVWLYIAPIVFALIGLDFLRDSGRVLRSTATTPMERATKARYLAGQGAIGLLTSAALFILIFYRKELLRCVTGFF